jgi:hypothetical protein
MNASASEEESESEKLQEIDFADVGKFCKEMNVVAPSNPNPHPHEDVVIVEEMFTGFSIEAKAVPEASSSRKHTATHDSHFETTHLPARTQHTSRFQSSSVIIEDSATAAHFTLHDTKPSHPLREDHTITAEDSPMFFIDTNPTPPHQTGEVYTEEIVALEQQNAEEEPDEIIVYVAPHPRIRKAPDPQPQTPAISLPTTSVLTGTSQPFTPTHDVPSIAEPNRPISTSQTTSDPLPTAPAFESVSFSFADSPIPKKQPRHAPAFSAGAKARTKIKDRRKEAALRRKRSERSARFSSFGAIVSEARLREEGPNKDPRWDERRRGDSDVDWGGESEEEANVRQDEELWEAGELDLDSDLEIGIDDLKRFVKGMSPERARFVTMDDIADEERMRREDEDEDEDDRGSSADEEMDAAVNQAEAVEIAEPRNIEVQSDDDEEEEFSSDDELSPRTGFQTRLNRLRNNPVNGKKGKDRASPPGSDSSEDDFFPFTSLADETEEFISSLDVSHLLVLEPSNAIQLSISRTCSTSRRMCCAVTTGNLGNSYFERYRTGTSMTSM